MCSDDEAIGVDAQVVRDAPQQRRSAAAMLTEGNLGTQRSRSQIR